MIIHFKVNDHSLTIINCYKRFVNLNFGSGSINYRAQDVVDIGTGVVWMKGGALVPDTSHLRDFWSLMAEIKTVHVSSESALLDSHTFLSEMYCRLRCPGAFTHHIVGISVNMVVFIAVRRQEFNMFTTAQREQVRHHILELAKADHRVTGGAFTGSMALGSGDRWSDIDLVFGIKDSISLETVLQDWTSLINHPNQRNRLFRPSFRLKYLPRVPTAKWARGQHAVTPGEQFGARGPQFHILFGSSESQDVPQPTASYFIGLSSYASCTQGLALNATSHRKPNTG